MAQSRSEMRMDSNEPDPARATIVIMGRAFMVPARTFEIDGKKIQFWPDELIFHVYEPGQPPVGPSACSARIDVARRLMRKRGRILNLCIDYRPRRWPYWSFVSRIVIARIGRRDIDALRIEYAGQVYE